MSGRVETRVQHHGFFSMGTRFDLVLAGMDEQEGTLLASDLRAECERIENLLSIHRTGSALSLLNSSAHAGWMETDPELLEILREFHYYHEKTHGYFDPACTSPTPTPTPTPTKTKTKTISLVEISDQGVRFGSRDVRIDPGGYGKGYAVKRMLVLMAGYEVGSALLSFGGSLVYGFGSHPHGRGWPLSVPLPGNPGEGNIILENEALSVSGNSLNNRKKFANSGHIVNPLTGQYRNEAGIVCVKSRDPVEAEVFSTALFSAGTEAGISLLQSNTELEVRWFME